LDDVFPFFAAARNLEALTPDFLRFEVLRSSTPAMEAGTLIDYRLRLRGIPMRWQSEITVWEPPFRFVDEQRRGPYRRWHHEHTFEEVDGRTVARDHVIYDHLGGQLVNRFLVAKDIARIFEYRERRLLEIFPPSDAAPAAL
jgi:hypothetical protein